MSGIAAVSLGGRREVGITQFENFDKKNLISRFFKNKKIENNDYWKIFRHDKFLLKLKRELNCYKNEILFFKHKYFKLLLFYKNIIK